MNSIASLIPSLSIGGWPVFIAALLGSLGLGGLLKTWLDYQRGKRKQSDDMASQVVGVAMGRLKSVERHSIICEANLAYQRHKSTNLASAFDSFLVMMEVAPEKQPEIVARLKEKRLRDVEAEAVERGAILAAALASLGEEDSDSFRSEIPK